MDEADNWVKDPPLFLWNVQYVTHKNLTNLNSWSLIFQRIPTATRAVRVIDRQFFSGVEQENFRLEISFHVSSFAWWM